MLEALKTAHPKQLNPKVYEISRLMTPLRDIQASYEKLKLLCMPGLLVFKYYFAGVIVNITFIVI